MDRRRLTPFKSEALAAMRLAPLAGAWGEGWRDRDGRVFNTHTVAWLVCIGLAAFNRERTRVMISRFGELHLEHEDLAA